MEVTLLWYEQYEQKIYHYQWIFIVTGKVFLLLLVRYLMTYCSNMSNKKNMSIIYFRATVLLCVHCFTYT